VYCVNNIIWQLSFFRKLNTSLPIRPGRKKLEKSKIKFRFIRKREQKKETGNRK